MGIRFPTVADLTGRLPVNSHDRRIDSQRGGDTARGLVVAVGQRRYASTR